MFEERSQYNEGSITVVPPFCTTAHPRRKGASSASPPLTPLLAFIARSTSSLLVNTCCYCWRDQSSFAAYAPPSSPSGAQHELERLQLLPRLPVPLLLQELPVAGHQVGHLRRGVRVRHGLGRDQPKGHHPVQPVPGPLAEPILQVLGGHPHQPREPQLEQRQQRHLRVRLVQAVAFHAGLGRLGQRVRARPPLHRRAHLQREQLPALGLAQQAALLAQQAALAQPLAQLAEGLRPRRVQRAALKQVGLARHGHLALGPRRHLVELRVRHAQLRLDLRQEEQPLGVQGPGRRVLHKVVGEEPVHDALAHGGFDGHHPRGGDAQDGGQLLLQLAQGGRVPLGVAVRLHQEAAVDLLHLLVLALEHAVHRGDRPPDGLGLRLARGRAHLHHAGREPLVVLKELRQGDQVGHDGRLGGDAQRALGLDEVRPVVGAALLGQPLAAERDHVPGVQQALHQWLRTRAERLLPQEALRFLVEQEPLGQLAQQRLGLRLHLARGPHGLHHGLGVHVAVLVQVHCVRVRVAQLEPGLQVQQVLHRARARHVAPLALQLVDAVPVQLQAHLAEDAVHLVPVHALGLLHQLELGLAGVAVALAFARAVHGVQLHPQLAAAHLLHVLLPLHRLRAQQEDHVREVHRVPLIVLQRAALDEVFVGAQLGLALQLVVRDEHVLEDPVGRRVGHLRVGEGGVHEGLHPAVPLQHLDDLLVRGRLVV
mmetsp:Transcript_17350/g.33005  ORF Transcript_17350/g.33005 Transcript_17350/m.33005 type:complete len:710 (-) Transcript_17350:1357-3486(-)